MIVVDAPLIYLAEHFPYRARSPRKEFVYEMHPVGLTETPGTDAPVAARFADKDVRLIDGSPYVSVTERSPGQRRIPQVEDFGARLEGTLHLGRSSCKGPLGSILMRPDVWIEDGPPRKGYGPAHPRSVFTKSRHFNPIDFVEQRRVLEANAARLRLVDGWLYERCCPPVIAVAFDRDKRLIKLEFRAEPVGSVSRDIMCFAPDEVSAARDFAHRFARMVDVAPWDIADHLNSFAYEPGTLERSDWRAHWAWKLGLAMSDWPAYRPGEASVREVQALADYKRFFTGRSLAEPFELDFGTLVESYRRFHARMPLYDHFDVTRDMACAASVRELLECGTPVFDDPALDDLEL